MGAEREDGQVSALGIARQSFLAGAVMDAARAQQKVGRLIYVPEGLDPEEQKKLIEGAAIDFAEALRVMCREIIGQAKILPGLPLNRAEELEHVLTKFIVGGPLQ
jgi:hypothetical protein